MRYLRIKEARYESGVSVLHTIFQKMTGLRLLVIFLGVIAISSGVRFDSRSFVKIMRRIQLYRVVLAASIWSQVITLSRD